MTPPDDTETGRISARLATARRRTIIAAAGAGAVSLAAARRAEAAAVDPYSSGKLGNWRAYGRAASRASVDRSVAAHPDGVRLVGDSIANGVLRPLTTAFANRGRPMSWDAWAGRPTAPLVDSVRACVDAGTMPPTLVVVSGANDIFASAAFEPAARRLLAAVPESTRVLWVTPSVQRRTSPTPDVRNSALVGLALERAAATRENLTLVRWFEFLAAKPATRIPAYLVDGVHPTNPRGYAALVSLVLAAA
ncbi:hypothetical protein [Agilicoccus flavus]|uniref:hypothetical protein n=1 Tax=Agilicoccus flavus TaxID=2775968 RepID=UPI001CF64930|nr:hypothetical protein [Agilicoccus flavus]